MKSLSLILILSFSSYAENKSCKETFKNPPQSKQASKNTEQNILKEELLKKIEKTVLNMFSKTLVLPRIRDLSAHLKITQKQVKEIIGNQISEDFWLQAQKENPSYIKNLKKDIARAFIASLKSDEVKWRNKTPNAKRLYEIYTKKHDDNHEIFYPKNMMTEHDLKVMLGEKPNPKKTNGALPVLFEDGIKGVESLAKHLTPSVFQNYIDTTLFSFKEDQKTADMVIKANGAIISTVTAGIPTNKRFFKSLLHYADKKNIPIVLIPVNRQTDGIDPYLLSKPDKVRIVTHTIEFSEYLRLWMIPVMPKNANPFASLDTFNQGQRGQIQIVGSPQLLYKTVPTADNKDITHGLWSPGSVSENLYPSKNPASFRVSELAKNRHTIGALILEQTDKKSGPNQAGSPGFFHIRPVKYFDQRKDNGLSGFIDLNQLYTPNNQKTKDIDIMVIGDLHDHNADQVLLQVHEDIIREHNIQTLVLHDALDGNSHNHHESKRLGLQLEKYRRGELSIENEVYGLIQTMNGFLQKFPDLNIVLVDSNHHYWLENLLDDSNAIKDIANKEFLLELLFARAHLGVNVYEYLFNHHRQSFHEGLEPRISYKKRKNSIYISDPKRVKVLRPGEPFIAGPDNNPVHLHFHGHKGANGAKGGMPSHAKAVEQSVTGDSHQPAILGKSVNVGVSTEKVVPYTEGGYSSWQSGIALVDSSTGNIQLIIYEPLTGTSWKQDSKNGFLPLAPPKVHETDNEMAPEDADILDQYNKHLFNK